MGMSRVSVLSEPEDPPGVVPFAPLPDEEVADGGANRDEDPPDQEPPAPFAPFAPFAGSVDPEVTEDVAAGHEYVPFEGNAADGMGMGESPDGLPSAGAHEQPGALAAPET
jgi:hypothetical protein